MQNPLIKVSWDVIIMPLHGRYRKKKLAPLMEGPGNATLASLLATTPAHERPYESTTVLDYYGDRVHFLGPITHDARGENPLPTEPHTAPSTRRRRPTRRVDRRRSMAAPAEKPKRLLRSSGCMRG